MKILKTLFLFVVSILSTLKRFVVSPLIFLMNTALINSYKLSKPIKCIPIGTRVLKQSVFANILKR